MFTPTTSCAVTARRLRAGKDANQLRGYLRASKEAVITAKSLAQITMCNMYTNHVVRGDDSTFSHGKGRESAMTVSSGFRKICHYCKNPAPNKAQCFKFLRESGTGDHYFLVARQEGVSAVCITFTFPITLTAALNINSVATAGAEH